MKAEDVVFQLKGLLPSFTNKFTDQFTLTSLTSVGGIATATTSSPNGLAAGNAVTIFGTEAPMVITGLTRFGIIGTLITDTDHDLTMGVSTSVELEGSTEPEFNGTFTLLSVPNRRTATFQMVDAGPIIATGAPLLVNGSNYLDSYNGLKAVLSVIDDITFTYAVPVGLFSPANIDNATLRIQPRISAAISLERLVEGYTKQAPESYWLFVVLGDVTASKDRNVLSDAVSNIQRSGYFRQQLLQNMNVYVVIPTSDQLGARLARDEAEVLFKPLCQSILFEEFDSGLYVGKQGPLQFISHGFIAYNTAFYIHGYTFEQVVDLQFEDTVGYSEDVAFRDILLSMKLANGTDPFTKAINLDEDPL